MKVKEIITAAGWIDGSGYSYSTTISDQVIDVPEEMLAPGAKMDWSWMSKDELADGEDCEITVEYYRPDYDPMFDDDEPLATWSIWESQL